MSDPDLFQLSRNRRPKQRPVLPVSTNGNSRQGTLIDLGTNDLPGQALLFAVCPGDRDNPTTQENRIQR